MFCPRCHRTYDEPAQRYCPDDGAALEGAAEVRRIRAHHTKQVGIVLDGRYVVRGFIGKGGMARVYLAEDAITKGPVAVKILNKEVARDKVARARFLREIDVAATIGHPNVVQVLDAGERPDGSPFIVLEYLFGESLGDLLRRDGRVDEAFAVPMLERAASALAAAHRVGIIHRDVKPDNLFLVGERGAPYTIKVVDFGMAKLEQGSKLSTTGMTLGTLAYIAPEQALTDPVDARADVYSLGVVMYRMLTGQLPFDSADEPLMVAKHLFVDPPPPLAVAPGLDPRLDAVIRTALRKRPENRYPSMEALAQDLERVLGRREGEVVARPPTVAPDLYQPVTAVARNAAEVFRGLVRPEPSAPRR